MPPVNAIKWLGASLPGLRLPQYPNLLQILQGNGPINASDTIGIGQKGILCVPPPIERETMVTDSFRRLQEAQEMQIEKPLTFREKARAIWNLWLRSPERFIKANLLGATCGLVTGVTAGLFALLLMSGPQFIKKYGPITMLLTSVGGMLYGAAFNSIDEFKRQFHFAEQIFNANKS